MFERVLVPLDGSERAEQAVPVAARLASATKGTVILIRVVPIVSQYAPYLATGPSLPPGSVEDEIAEAKRYLTQVANSEELAGIAVETDVVVGPPAPVLVDAIYERSVDTVAMCSHGRTGFTRWALGSVAEHLARESAVPVLVLRPAPTGSVVLEPETMQPMRILVPLDGSARAEAVLPGAIAMARSLTHEGRAAVHLLTVVDLYQAISQRAPQGTELDAAKKYLAETAKRARAEQRGTEQVDITWSVASDVDVATAVLKVAERGTEAEEGGSVPPCGAIAMATHGRSGFARLALGSITERVLQGTKLPLLIVRARNGGQREPAMAGRTTNRTAGTAP